MSVGGPATVTVMPSLRMPWMFERATRLCAMSPTIATLSPSKWPLCSRMVRRSSSACVGCSWAPSPALTISSTISVASSARIVKRSLRVHPMSGLLRFFDHHAVLAVVLLEPHRHAFAPRGGQVLADEIRADRQLAVAPVDQDRELDGRRAPEVDQRIERRANRPAGVEDVVDEHDRLVLDGERDVGAANDR